ncbi:EpsG family protein [Acinetobacter towneri]|uniref:EpsG family protein n=1 Tax=Acinetobacter towneri TaxID=202956 RepID=UPI003A85319B
MLEYVVLYAIFLLAVISQIYYKQQMAFFLFFVGLIISTLISAFRDMIGGYDIYIYSQYFEYIEYNILPYEYGYYLYNLFLSFLNSDRQTLFFFTAILFSLALYNSSFIKNIRFYTVVLFILFCKLYFYSFVYLRQILAAIIVWWAIYNLINNKKNFFILLVLLASSFHLSALIALPLYFMTKVIKFNNIILIYILGFLFGVVFNMQALFGLIGSSLDNERILGAELNAIKFNYFYVVEATLIFFWILLNYKFYIKYERDKVIIFNVSIYYCLFVLLTVKDATAVRMCWYLLIGPAWLIAHNLDTRFNGYKYFALIVILYFSVIFFRTMFLWDGGDFLPYKSIYSDVQREGRWEHLEYR